MNTNILEAIFFFTVLTVLVMYAWSSVKKAKDEQINDDEDWNP